MAVPATTARVQPTGYPLPDGLSTTIAFARAPTVQFWEKTVKPPGLDAGGGIDFTSMFNARYRTMRGKRLLTVSPPSGKAFYDPDCWPALLTIMGRQGEGSVTIHHPDNSTTDIYGYLDKATPGENKEGEAPELDYELVVTNWDPVNNIEQGPVFTPAAGT